MPSSNVAPLLSTRCRIPGRSLWFPRAELFHDHICLSGWTWRGRFQKCVPLSEVETVQWWAVEDDVNFLLHLTSGRKLPLHLFQGAGMWNWQLHEMLGVSLLADSRLPEASSAPDDAPVRRDLAA